MYDTRGELYFHDARKIVSEQLPDFDLLVGGFPCFPVSLSQSQEREKDLMTQEERYF